MTSHKKLTAKLSLDNLDPINQDICFSSYKLKTLSSLSEVFARTNDSRRDNIGSLDDLDTHVKPLTINKLLSPTDNSDSRSQSSYREQSCKKDNISRQLNLELAEVDAEPLLITPFIPRNHRKQSESTLDENLNMAWCLEQSKDKLRPLENIDLDYSFYDQVMNLNKNEEKALSKEKKMFKFAKDPKFESKNSIITEKNDLQSQQTETIIFTKPPLSRSKNRQILKDITNHDKRPNKDNETKSSLVTRKIKDKIEKLYVDKQNKISNNNLETKPKEHILNRKNERNTNFENNQNTEVSFIQSWKKYIKRALSVPKRIC